MNMIRNSSAKLLDFHSIKCYQTYEYEQTSDKSWNIENNYIEFSKKIFGYRVSYL